MECSELAWVISTIDIPALLRQENKRFTVPGTPIIPEPSIFTRVMLSIVVIPLTLC